MEDRTDVNAVGCRAGIEIKHQGFTMVELVIVILILGILSATALPRFINQKENAMIARHRAVTGAFSSALAFAHQAWILEGAVPNAAGIVVVEGREAIFYTATGWPHSVDTTQNHHFCGRLFNALMTGVTAWSPQQDRVYFARQGPAGGCRYVLNEDSRLSFEYNGIDGQMTVDDVLE